MKAKITTIAIATMLILGAAPMPKIAVAQSDAIARKTHTGEGLVMWIKKRSGKIKLDHGPVKSIGWMSMKMVFNVEYKALLKGIKEGDKVSFTFYKAGEGSFVVTEIKHVK